MTTVLHVIDAACDETCLQVLAGLVGRTSEGERAHLFRALDGPAAVRARRWLPTPVIAAPVRLGGAVHWSPGLIDAVRFRRVDVVHAWGIQAAAAASLCLSDWPLVVTVLDPGLSFDAARWFRSLPVNAAVIAGNQAVKTRLVRHGVDADRICVVRSAVDFKAINAARSAGTRRVRIGEARPVLLLPGPPPTDRDAYHAIWGGAVMRQIHPGTCLLLPFGGPEAAWLRRRADQIGMRSLVIEPETVAPWPELVASADVLFAPVSEETRTEPLAWAMAAGIPIVAAAVRSVAEYLADHHNGLLFKPGDHKSMVRRLLQAVEDVDLARRLGEVARGQAYEVFGRRNFAENHERVYRNVVSSRPVSDGVTDTVFVG